LKKYLVVLFLLVLPLWGATGGLAGIDRNVCVNGRFLNIDVDPREDRGRIMIPARPVVEAVGGSIKFDEGAGMATVDHKGKTITLTVGSWRYDVNGRPGIMDLPPSFAKDRLLVPSTFFSAALGLDTYIEGTHGDVVINSQ